MRLNNYLTESIRQFPWNGNPKIGWWQDKSILTLYHGTHERNLQWISKNGIVPAKEGYTAGKVFLALEPNTAFGYASMSSSGGEAKFRVAGSKAVTTPVNERIVFIIELPTDYVIENSFIKDNLYDKDEYEKSNSDMKFYQLKEIAFLHAIKPRYIKGWMKKT